MKQTNLSQSKHSSININATELIYKRIVVKIGTTLLTGGKEQLALDIMDSLVNQIACLHDAGAEVILVSSGAVAAGRQILKGHIDRKDIPYRQVLASIGQGKLIHIYEQLFSKFNILVAQSLLSRRDFANRLGYLNIRNTLEALLEFQVVPIVNENDVVAVEELAIEAFGDNDNLSALVANLIDADLLAILGEVNGLYTADPNRNTNAKLIPIVSNIDKEVENLAGNAWLQGRGGMATKIEAAKLATASGVRVAIANGRESEIIMRLAKGENIGTSFEAVSSKMESRKRWMLSRLSNSKEIGLIIDKGAVDALGQRKHSLLGRGIIEVKGLFTRGTVILIFNTYGIRVACGICNYDSKDIDIIKGQHSNKIEDLLGYKYGDEIIHKNNMMLL
jgi:glutamate 5-kinase